MTARFIPQAPGWQPGERLSAGKLQQMSNAINDASRVVRLGPVHEEPAPGNSSLLLEILSINDVVRFLTCIVPGQSGNPSAIQYPVLLPPVFNNTTHGGFTYTYQGLNQRTDDQGEVQLITPGLEVGETIPVVLYSNGIEYYFAGDGRMWGKVP